MSESWSAMFGLLLRGILATIVCAQPVLAQLKQTPEVLDAYRICEKFESVLRRQLDFDTAYEATFVKNNARRRAIAIKDGEFETDLTSVDDVTVINAYKSRMQLLYLMLPLASPVNNEQEALFFPPEMKQIFKRKAPLAPADFPAYAAQLERDVSSFRAHLNSLAARYPFVAERIRDFKSDVLSTKFVPPDNRVVEPLRDPFEGRVIRKNEPHYEINGYTVIREGSEMRIAGIRFFTRLF